MLYGEKFRRVSIFSSSILTTSCPRKIMNFNSAEQIIYNSTFSPNTWLNSCDSDQHYISTDFSKMGLFGKGLMSIFNFENKLKEYFWNYWKKVAQSGKISKILRNRNSTTHKICKYYPSLAISGFFVRLFYCTAYCGTKFSNQANTKRVIAAQSRRDRKFPI